MFNELKHLFGLQQAWQQSRQPLARWTTILSLAYALPRLLALWLTDKEGKEIFPIAWRKHLPISAGWMAKAIDLYFRGFPVRSLWDRKCQKMKPPEEDIEPVFREPHRKKLKPIRIEPFRNLLCLREE